MADVENQNQTKADGDIYTISFSMEAVPPDEVDEVKESEPPSDFDAAIEATEYGLYNYLLLLAVFPAGWANIFDTTTMSYILPSAECDLELTLNQKGLLNAVIYTGIITSAFFWGFLADTKGRWSLLVIGYLTDSICNILSSMSQSFHVMMVFKFFSGFVISGPLAIIMTYLAEFHSTKYRSATLYWTSLFSAAGNIALPALAWAIIPQSWSFTLFDGAFVYNSWRIFIFVCSMPAFLAFLALLYFPESPKYLMTQGRNDEALKIFQKMYAMNTGNPPESFPIKSLSMDGQKKKIEPSEGRSTVSLWQKTAGALSNISPLFVKPYFGQCLLVIFLQFGSILALNTLRLWMPQLFTLMENFDYKNRDPGLGAPTLCEMISIPKISNATFAHGLNTTIEATCIVPPVPSKVYINSMIIASTTVLGFTLVGTLVHLIGKKNLLLISFAIPTACIVALNWSPDSSVTLGIMAVYIAFTSISTTTIITFIVDLMPTSLRTMAVSLTISIGRGGAMMGNVLFPILLSAGCLAPFIFIGGFLVLCFTMTIFIPKPPAKLL